MTLKISGTHVANNIEAVVNSPFIVLIRYLQHLQEIYHIDIAV